jgi:hypothetical protein
MSEEIQPTQKEEPTSSESPALPPKVSWTEILYGGDNPADHSMNWTFAGFGLWVLIACVVSLLALMVPSVINGPWAIWLILKSAIVFGLTGLGIQMYATILVCRSRYDREHRTQRYYAIVLCLLGWMINGIIGLALLFGGLLDVK